MDTLACTAPEMMLARIGAETQRIRIGSGGIMLPHYSAFKVAEVFRTLHALYPGRVDLGIGRAPGGGPVETLALKRDRAAKMVDDFPAQVEELLAYFNGFSCGIRLGGCGFHRDAGWAGCLDAGVEYVELAAAADFGLPYSFAHFFSPVHTRAAIQAYQRGFLAAPREGARKKPEATVRWE